MSGKDSLIISGTKNALRPLPTTGIKGKTQNYWLQLQAKAQQQAEKHGPSIFNNGYGYTGQAGFQARNVDTFESVANKTAAV